MNRFIKQFTHKLIGGVTQLNCCHNLQAAMNKQTSAIVTLPGDITILITAPSNWSEDQCGSVYIDEFDLESPQLELDELIDWTNDTVNCCRKINKKYNELNSLNCVLSPLQHSRIRKTWLTAQAAVQLPTGFRWATLRENKQEDVIIGSLMYTSTALGETEWVAKSALSAEFSIGATEDDWAFEPNYLSPWEPTLKHRENSMVTMDKNLYTETIKGESPTVRDKQAAFWLMKILNKMMDSILHYPPARCYELFLADGISDIKLEDLAAMSKNGLAKIVRRGLVDPAEALKIQPDLLKSLLENNLIDGETAGTIIPKKIPWLVTHDYLDVEKALELDPTVRGKLEKAGVIEPAPTNVDSSRQSTQPEVPVKNDIQAKPVTQNKIPERRTASRLLNSRRRNLPKSRQVSGWIRTNSNALNSSTRTLLRNVESNILDTTSYRFTNTFNASTAFSNKSQPIDTVQLNGTDKPTQEGNTPSVTESIKDTNISGAAWLLRGTVGDNIVTDMIVPGNSKVEVLDLYTKAFGPDSYIVSWELPISDIQKWKQDNPDSNLAVVLKR